MVTGADSAAQVLCRANETDGIDEPDHRKGCGMSGGLSYRSCPASLGRFIFFEKGPALIAYPKTLDWLCSKRSSANIHVHLYVHLAIDMKLILANPFLCSIACRGRSPTAVLALKYLSSDATIICALRQLSGSAK
jgi:hypothetical protein